MTTSFQARFEELFLLGIAKELNNVTQKEMALLYGKYADLSETPSDAKVLEQLLLGVMFVLLRSRKLKSRGFHGYASFVYKVQGELQALKARLLRAT